MTNPSVAKRPMVSKWSRKSTDPSGLDHWVSVVKRGRKCSCCNKKIHAGEQSLRYIDRYRTLDFKSKKNNYIKLQVERAICVECAKTMLNELLEGINRPTDQQLYEKAELRRQQKYAKEHPETEW